MDRHNPTIIKEKPMRGREMNTQVMPSSLSIKEPDPKKQKSERKLSLYHEGYVDDKKYLVPDSNLQAMKDDVITQLKVKGLKGINMEEEDSYDLNQYDRVSRRVANLSSRMDYLGSDEEDDDENRKKGVNEEEKGEEIEEVGEEEKFSEEEEEPVEEEQAQEEPTEEEQIQEEPKEEEQIQKEPLEGNKFFQGEQKEDKPAQTELEPLSRVPHRQPDPDRLRLLISGHYREDHKPIFIVQEYGDEQNIFKDQKANFQFRRHLSEDGIDVNLSGRFYNKTILEETEEGKPVALNISPERILIDETRIKVYGDYFEEFYNFQSLDVSLKGEFLKSAITKRITPFLAFAFTKDLPPENRTSSENKKEDKNIPTTVYTCKLKPTVQFPDSSFKKT